MLWVVRRAFSLARGEGKGLRRIVPTAMPAPVPTRAGNVLRFAAVTTPPLPWGTLPGRSEILKSSSLFRMSKRSEALSSELGTLFQGHEMERNSQVS